MTEDQPQPKAAQAEEPRYPADASAEVAKGYAVYDTQLQRYVSGVYGLDDKPSSTAAKELAPNGHRIVKV